MISLKRIFISLIIFFILIGGIFAFISTQLFYSKAERESTQEKEREMQVIAGLAFTNDTSVAHYPYATNLPRLIEILELAGAERGINFFRIIQKENQTVVASNIENEIGSKVDTLPFSEVGSVRVSSGTHLNTPSLSLSYEDRSGNVLWLSMERVFFAGPTVLLAIQQSFLFAALILFITAALYLVGNVFIIKPLKEVQESLLSFGTGNLATRLPAGPPNEFGRVFNAFNSMAVKLEEARKRDQHVSEMKSVFISTAAHQLRTPLSGVRWALSGLLSGEFGALSKEQKDLLDDVTEKNTEVITIVNTLLDVVSIEEGAFSFSEAPVDLDVLTKSIVENMIQKADPSHPLPTYTLKNSVSEFMGDSMRLKWTIENLIENAVQYTPATGSVTVTLESTVKNICLTIQDTGIGIPSSEKGRMFEKFSRGTNAVRLRSNGNGLGLFIAKNIIEHYKGTIAFTSKVGKGTTFTVTLPKTPPTRVDGVKVSSEKKVKA